MICFSFSTLGSLFRSLLHGNKRRHQTALTAGMALGISVRMEKLRMTAGTKRTDVNMLRCNAALLKQQSVRPAQITMATRAILSPVNGKHARAELLTQGDEKCTIKRLVDFVAAHADGVSDGRTNQVPFGTERTHGGYRFCGNARKCSAPSRVTRANDAVYGIREQNRHAICDTHSKRNSGCGGYKTVKAVRCKRIVEQCLVRDGNPHTAMACIHAQNTCGVRLVGAQNVIGRNAKTGCKAAVIFFRNRTLLTDRKPNV